MPKKGKTDIPRISETTERIDLGGKVERTEVFEKTPIRKGLKSQKVPCLVVVEGDHLGEVFPITRNPTMIGRSGKCGILIADASISRRHARIQKEAGRYVLKDLKSTNGVMVNGLAVSSKPLEEGDKIQLGRVMLRFDYEDPLDQSYHRKLRSLAIHDGLTKIYNKGHFLEVLKKELAFAARNDIRLSLVVFDIDDFKQVNDTCGHTVGDLVLRTIAGLLAVEVRGYDCFARFGGEEFVFLLRQITPENTLSFCERIRKIVECHPFIVEKKPRTVTISLGFAWADPSHKYATPEEFLTAADKYLYEAKAAGKNRVGHPPL